MKEKVTKCVDSGRSFWRIDSGHSFLIIDSGHSWMCYQHHI